MKNLMFLMMFLFIHACGCTGVFAQTTPNTQTIFEGIDSKQNYIKNPYARINELNISCVNATKSRDGSADKLYGAASWSIDSSSQNGYCEFNLRPILSPDDNGNCEFKGVVKGDASLYRAQILNSSADLKAQTLVLGNNINWREFSVNAPCQSTPKVRITQTEAGTAPAIKLGVYYGPNTNIGSATPPNQFSFYVNTLGAVTNRAGRLDIAPTSCTMSGTNSATGSCNFLQTLNSFPNCSVSGVGSAAIQAKLNNTGSTTTAVQYFAYNTSTGADTASSVIIKCDLSTADSVQPAVTAQNFDFSDRDFTPTLSTGAIGTGGTQIFKYRREGPNMIITIDYQPSSAGTIGSGQYTMTVPGGYSIKYTGSSAASYGAGYIYNGSSQETVAQASWSSATQIGFRIQTSSTAYSSWGSASFPLNAANFRLGITFSIPIAGWDVAQGAPQLLGSITSDYSGAQKTIAGIFAGASISTNCTTSPCTIYKNYGGIASATRGAIGTYTVTFATSFNDFPVCLCSCTENGTAFRACTASYGSNSAVNLVCQTGETVPQGKDATVQFSCTGPR